MGRLGRRSVKGEYTRGGDRQAVTPAAWRGEWAGLMEWPASCIGRRIARALAMAMVGTSIGCVLRPCRAGHQRIERMFWMSRGLSARWDTRPVLM